MFGELFVVVVYHLLIRSGDQYVRVCLGHFSACELHGISDMRLVGLVDGWATKGTHAVRGRAETDVTSRSLLMSPCSSFRE